MDNLGVYEYSFFHARESTLRNNFLMNEMLRHHKKFNDTVLLNTKGSVCLVRWNTQTHDDTSVVNKYMGCMHNFEMFPGDGCAMYTAPSSFFLPETKAVLENINLLVNFESKYPVNYDFFHRMC